MILDAAALVKERNPEAIFTADPVMGDSDRGFYARPGIPEFWRDHVIASADITTPNLFELEFLTGEKSTTIDDVVRLARVLRERGPQIVLVTSVVGEGTPWHDRMRMIAVGRAQAWRVEARCWSAPSPGPATSPRPPSSLIGCAPGPPADAGRDRLGGVLGP
ncbi:MAG: PfkB family carbohydrate kinase [Tessaracoccus sp.]